MPPISTAGDRLEWKKAQNTLKKANTSLITNKIKPNNNSSPPKGKPWKYITALIAIVNKVKLVTNGQGDCSTKWKAKDWNLLLCVEIGLLKLVI